MFTTQKYRPYQHKSTRAQGTQSLDETAAAGQCHFGEPVSGINFNRVSVLIYPRFNRRQCVSTHVSTRAIYNLVRAYSGWHCQRANGHQPEQKRAAGNVPHTGRPQSRPPVQCDANKQNSAPEAPPVIAIGVCGARTNEVVSARMLHSNRVHLARFTADG